MGLVLKKVSLKVNKTLRTILNLITENPEATTTTLVATIEKSRSTVQKCIKILKEENCIDEVGGKKYGKWVVIKFYTYSTGTVS